VAKKSVISGKKPWAAMVRLRSLQVLILTKHLEKGIFVTEEGPKKSKNPDRQRRIVMNKASILKVTVIAATACFLVCEPVPQNAITDARTALEKAEKSGGRIWAPTQLKTGHIFYDSAMKELVVEKRKLPFKRDYKKIIEFLDIAAEAGYYAMESVQKANERIRSESQELIDRAKILADSVDGVLKEAAANRKNVRNLQAALDSARMAREEALAVLNSGDLFLAEGKAISANNKTEEVAKRIAQTLLPTKKSAGKKKL
jgi:hypothetical protein